MGSLSQEGKIDGFPSPSLAARSPPPSSSNSSNSSSSSSSSDAKYIEHTVSKLDTLAGIAIKYGVEVSDIKRINGLVTDIQMFAHKSLFIPLPGRHPPTPRIHSNGFSDKRDWSPPRRPRREVLDSLQSLKMKSHQSGEISPAMSSLQRYYGLLHHKGGSTAEGTEMTVYRTSSSSHTEDELLPASGGQPTRYTDLPRSYLPENDDLFQNLLLGKSGDGGDGEKHKTDKSVRRRPKADTDPLSLPEASAKDDSRGFIGRLGRALAPRALFSGETDTESARQNTRPAEEGGSEAIGLLSVRKSSSTSSLQDSAGDSIWTSSSRWTLKPDSVARPIFSGLPKQMNVWRSKAALD